MPELGPEPFRRIDAAALGDVFRAKPSGGLGDLRRFAPAGVILPQPALRGKVVDPFFTQRERAVGGVDGNRAGSGGVDAEPDDPARVETGLAAGLGQRTLDAFLQSEEIVAGVLASQQAV